MPVPQFVLPAEGDVHGEDTPENREIVRRIHACVQACEGISTEELENGIVEDMQRVIGQVAPLLERQRQLEELLREQLPAADTQPQTDAQTISVSGMSVANG